MNRFLQRVPWIVGLALGLLLWGCARVDPATELAAAATNIAARNYTEAAVRLNSVVQVDPNNAEARRRRGQLALLLGDYVGAVADLTRARELGAPVDSVAIDLADALSAAGQPDRALAVLDPAASALNGSPAYWVVRAETLARAGRAADSERALDEGARAGDIGTRGLVARARLAFGANDHAAAEELLNRASSLAPSDPLVLVARGELHARKGQLTEAAADLSRAADLYHDARLDRFEETTLLSLAQIHLGRNDLDAAEATAKRLAQRAPQAALTSFMQGLVDYRRGRFDEAATVVQPLVSNAPDVPQFRSLLGAIYLARGNFGQAEQQFLAVLAKSPRDPAAVKLLAETRLRQQRPEAALSALRALEDSAAEDAQVGRLRGLASLLSGNTEQGLLYLEQAASLDPTNELLKLQLAQAYMAGGRDADAANLLKNSFGGGSANLEVGLLKLFAEARAGGQDSDAAANDLLSKFPEEPRALAAVALYYQSHGKNQRARELFEQAAKLEKDGATARLVVAAALGQEGRAQEAEELLRRVIAEQPDNIQALTALAELASARGKNDEAVQLLGRAAEHSTTVSPRLRLVQLYIRQGNLVAAKQELEISTRAAPDNPEVIAVRGLVALAEGQADEAANHLRRAASLLPNRLGITLALARAEMAGGRPLAARDALRKMLAVAPQSMPLRLALGDAELKLGNATEASSLAAALKVDYPTQSGGYLLDADVLLAGRRYSAAADSLAQAFERQKTWPVLVRLIGALQLAGKADEALNLTDQWVAANPQQVAPQLTRAALLQNAGRNEDALQAYQSLLAVDGNNLVALNNAAWLTKTLGKPGALALAQRANELAKDNPTVLDTLGWILVGEKREQEGITSLSRAAQLAPAVPEIRYHLAKALVAVGKSTEARPILETLVAGGQDFEERVEARRLLDSL